MHELFRTRWAAVGAAVAVTLGAGGVSLTQAAISDGEKPVYIALDAPCRIVDTRADSNVGPKNTVLAAGETNAYEIQVTGAHGNCTGPLAVPAGATGVALNVTAIARTAPVTGRSYFTVYPADAPRPVTSNLNFLADQPPVPNKVDVGLSDDGKIRIYNNEGEADVAVDVFGYYIDHTHSGADIVNGSITSDDIADDSVTDTDTANEPGIVSAFVGDVVPAPATPGSVASTSIRVPSDGYVQVNVSGVWAGDTPNEDEVLCQLQIGTVAAVDADEPSFSLNDHDGNVDSYTLFSAHRVLAISVDDNPDATQSGQNINLVCDAQVGDVSFRDIHITATFSATSYAPST